MTTPDDVVNTGLLTSAVVAALVAGLVAVGLAVVGHFVAGRRDAAARRRTTYADAFAAYAAYRELPYLVRRRQAGNPERERLRVSDQARAVQEKLTFYTAWVSSESAYVARFYATMVDEMRVRAGGELSRAWTMPAVTCDAQMNIGDVDLRALAEAEAAYLRAVKDHLAITPVFMFRFGRWVRRLVSDRRGRDPA